jgi:hypothetical protein
MVVASRQDRRTKSSGAQYNDFPTSKQVRILVTNGFLVLSSGCARRKGDLTNLLRKARGGGLLAEPTHIMRLLLLFGLLATTWADHGAIFTCNNPKKKCPGKH